MKRLIGIAVVFFMVIGVTSLANAAVFTFDVSDILQFYELAERPSDSGIGLFLAPTTNSPDAGTVGFRPYLSNYNNDYAPGYARINIGVNSAGARILDNNSTDNSGVTVAGLGASDLSAYTGFGLLFRNDDNSEWDVAVFVNGLFSGYTTLAGKTTNPINTISESVVLDFGGPGPNNVDRIGFVLRGNLQGVNPYPSNGDEAHMHVGPVPEPASMVLLGIGLVGLVGRKLRRKFQQ